jgi:16S rRNA A1518/A1519 N6-dimethyltransferase RsmA/KsgA/DIM1 with predicted DNA glycosylase/AP lyase activity
MVRETRHLCIGNLPYNVTEKILIDLFERLVYFSSIHIFYILSLSLSL